MDHYNKISVTITSWFGVTEPKFCVCVLMGGNPWDSACLCFPFTQMVGDADMFVRKVLH